MNIHRRAAAIVANEGFPGLLRRGAGKIYRTLTGRSRPKVAAAPAAGREQPRAEEDPVLARHRAEYPAQVEKFREEVRRRNLGDVNGFFWYHTVDLGDGLVTPGDYDYRDLLGDYPFPESMKGMTALDVGSATGFFAFEFERRGADVVSVDLPSVADWDMIWSDRQLLLPAMMKGHGRSTMSELDWAHMHGPFDFCHRMLKSKVRRVLSRIYDLTPEKLGRDGFDFLFLGDILGHLFSPLQALNALAPLCRKEMIISYSLVDLPGASIHYGGGEGRETDGRSWFQPNWEALRRMLRRVGFRQVEMVGVSRVVLRRTGWFWMPRNIIRAVK